MTLALVGGSLWGISGLRYELRSIQQSPVKFQEKRTLCLSLQGFYS